MGTRIGGIESSVCDKTIVFSRLSQINRLRLAHRFLSRSFSNAPFLNLGATDFRSEWRAIAILLMDDSPILAF